MIWASIGMIWALFEDDWGIIWGSFKHHLKMVRDPEPAELESESEPAEPEPARPGTRLSQTELGASWSLYSVPATI